MGFKTGAAGDSMGGSSTLRGSAGRTPIPNAASSISVVFAIPKANILYEPIFSVMNLVDSQPIFLQGIVTAISLAGFTVTFNAPTDTANYQLCWEAVNDV